MTRRFYQFGPFRLDAEKRVLMREGEVEPLAPKAFDMLLVLVQHHGEVLEKGALMEMLWPDSDVEEANLPQNISALRKALGESPNERRYIITIPGRGYRFGAEVEELDDDGKNLIMESYAKSNIVIQEQEASLIDSNRALSAPHVLSGRLKPSLAALAILAFIILLASGLWLWLSRKPSGQLSQMPIKSLAVLPFRQLAAEGDEYLGLGIADSLITRLSNLREIKVRPTSAVLKYNNQSKPPAEIGRELGVEAVLEGSIRRDGENIRVTVQLVRVEDGSPLWAEKFDDRFTSIFKIEDSMSGRVAEDLVPKLTGEEREALAKRHTDNTEAYSEYLKGRFFWNKRTVDGMKKAIEHFEQAIAHDPNYALAFSGLADSYLILGTRAARPAEVFPKAKAAAERALEIDSRLAEAHTSLAAVIWHYDWDWPAAEKEMQRAIDCNPNYATAHYLYAMYLAAGERVDEALAEMKRARELDPVSVLLITQTGRLFYFARQYDKAIAEYRKAIELEPDFWVSHSYLGWAYLQKGMYQEAIAAFQKTAAVSAEDPGMSTDLACAYALSGKRREAVNILNRNKDQSRYHRVQLYDIAVIHTLLGEKNQAFEWLEKAFEERSYLMLYLGVQPENDSLRSDPRFQNLLRRVGLLK